MALRQSGLSYTDIASRGGGIMKTVDATRNADLNRLMELGRKRLARAAVFGTTTMECKSGYGLSLDSELRLLKAIGHLSDESLLDIHPTWLGAHDFPKGVEAADYVEELINEQLPEVVEQGIARWADVFCEPGWYNLEQTEEVVTAAANAGLPSRLHVDEFVDGGGLALAAELGAVSGDHVGCSSNDARAAANEARTMQTFLPGTPYVLGKNLDSPVEQCLNNEWRFSLATDFNPNCRSLSIPFLGSLATHRLGLSPIEALAAVTRNPATTLARTEQEETFGSIRIGGRADILILDSEYVDGWCQMPGDNPVASTIANGTIVKS
jgi:imidazolonepropionase